MINWGKFNEIRQRERNREASNFIGDLETDLLTMIPMVAMFEPREESKWRKIFENIQATDGNEVEFANLARLSTAGIYKHEPTQCAWQGFLDALNYLGFVKKA